MPGGRGAATWLPRSVGVLATEEPTVHSMAGAVLARLRDELPAEVTMSFSGPRSADRLRLPTGVRRAASPADLAARAELLIIVVAELDAVRELLEGPAGVQAGVHSPTTQVIGCTCAPEALRTLAAELQRSTAGRLQTVDAPLVGQPADARAGKLLILAGATHPTFEAVAPVLSLLGPTMRIGGLGHGQIGAAGTQFLVAATMAALVESSLIARRSGVDLASMFRGWQQSDLLGRAVEDVASRFLGTEEVTAPTSLTSSLAVAHAEALRTRPATALLDVVINAHAGLAESRGPEDDVIQRPEQPLSAQRDQPTQVSGSEALDDPGRSTTGQSRLR